MNELTCPSCKKSCSSENRFCIHCGCLLDSEEVGAPCVGFSPDPSTAEGPATKTPRDETSEEIQGIRVDYQHLFLYAGKHGCIPFRFANREDRLIKKIILTVQSKAFEEEEQPLKMEREVRLGKGALWETRFCDFDIQDRDGFYRVQVRGYVFDEKENPHAFRGSFKLLVRDPHGEKASIVFEDGAAGMMDRVDVSAVKEIVIRDGAAADLGDVGRSFDEEEGGWVQIPLTEDFEQTRLLREWSQGKEKASGVPVQDIEGSSLPRAFLTFQGDQGSRTVHVWARERCLIGRNPEKSDLVCILLPSDERHRKENLLISQTHCTLGFKGGHIILEDENSANGTFVDGQRVTAPVSLVDGQILSLADKLHLRYREFRALSRERGVKDLLESCRSLVDCTTALSSLDLDATKERAPLDAFRLRRLNNYQERLEYLFLLRAASIGSSKNAAILAPYDSVSELHARLHVQPNGYWLEDMNSEKGTRVNGNQLMPFEPVPLGREARVSLGDIAMQFRVT